MRVLSIVLASTLVAACSTAPTPIQRSPRGEADLQRLLGGKVAGPAVACLPSFRTKDMTIIDDQTILYRYSRDLVYRVNMSPGCQGLGSGFHSLVTEKVGSSQTCRNDIARVVDLQSGITAGSCTFGDFIPYRTAGR